MSNDIDGYDPLATSFGQGENEKLLEDANRRIVQNILKSYTGYFDAFSELLQNALDSTEKRQRLSGGEYSPKIWITVDIDNPKIRVVDNGTGLNLEEFKFFLKPNVSFKNPKESRGQKGVGATFLAYGFSTIRVHTRSATDEIAAILRNGRRWAQDHSESVSRPKFESETFFVSELGANSTGAAVEVLLGGLPGERPNDLTWLGARTAEQWLNVLRIKTPLGGVYLNTSKFKPQVYLKVVDSDGTVTETECLQPEYFYPHVMEGIKTATVKDLEKSLSKIQGSPDQRFSKLGSEFKRLGCLWEIYSREDLVDDEGMFNLTSEQRALVERHNVVVYAAFLASAKMWGGFNDNELKLRKGQKIVYGGLQMASDNMVQGDLKIIPLKRAIGYQANAHIIVHFTDGAPDMGRKVFQPELTELADQISVRSVNTFQKYLQHLKPDTGAVNQAPDHELHEWKKSQELYRDKNPIELNANGKSISLMSRPQQEQDVIALFHQLIGLGILRGYKFFATSQSDRYDSLFELEYPDDNELRFSKVTHPLGIDHSIGLPFRSEPRVLEYKFDLDALIRDFNTDIKFSKHINLVVCWKADKQFREKYYLSSLLIGDEGTSRYSYGATHQAFRDDGGSQPDFEVLILEDLISFLTNPVEEEARQKAVYKD